MQVDIPDGPTFIHVIPSDDIHDHHLDDFCLCDPKVEKVDEAAIMWTHNSWDRREKYEQMSHSLSLH